MPIVSIIIPAHNAEKYISKTIESIQQQTFSDFEIIVIDDGSSDSTLKVLSGILEKRLKIHSYRNGGVAVARNRGIAHSTGEFLTFLDADDLWTSDFLELHLAALQQHPEADVAYCWTARIDQKDCFLRLKPSVFFEGNIYSQLLGKSFLDCGSLLIRRQAIELVGEFDVSLRFSEDWDYWVRLARYFSFVLVPKYQLLYRQWPGSSSSQLDQIEQHEKDTLRSVEKAFQAAPTEFQHFKKTHLANLSLRFARLYIIHQVYGRQSDINGIKEAGQRILKAVQLNPKLVLKLGTLRILGKWLLIKTLFSNRLAITHDSARDFIESLNKKKLNC